MPGITAHSYAHKTKWYWFLSIHRFIYETMWYLDFTIHSFSLIHGVVSHSTVSRHIIKPVIYIFMIFFLSKGLQSKG